MKEKSLLTHCTNTDAHFESTKLENVVTVPINIKGIEIKKNSDCFQEMTKDWNKTPIKQFNCGNKIQQH